MREVGDSAPPVIIWIGILPGSLSAIDGINIAIHCRSILCSPNLDDIHVETRESRVVQASKLYKPTSRFNPAANALMPQSPCICSSYPPIYWRDRRFLCFRFLPAWQVLSCHSSTHHLSSWSGLQWVLSVYQLQSVSLQCFAHGQQIVLLDKTDHIMTSLFLFFPLSVCIIKHHSSINTRFTVGSHSVVYHTGWRLRWALVLWYPDRLLSLYYR